ncbi:MAG TPA: TetR/AcrR family transcriptional regulator [Rhizomicrobium sp.]|jgi:AcrR family transcriptional regulator
MAEKEDVRTQIVEAAKKRFSHFGYAKTTMAEVATDCAMSPGNLYRFFPGKLDIAEYIATQDFQNHLGQLAALAEAPGKTARERLHDLLFEELRRTYHKLESDPRAYEIALIISRERPEFANWMLANERKIIVKVLEDGRARAEFAGCNLPVEQTAEMIQAAVMKFRYPQLWSKLTLPKLETELEGVMQLIVDGLSPRLPCPEAA